MAFLLYSGFTTNRETLSDKTVTEYILSSDFTGRRIGCDWMKIYGKLNSIIWRSMRQTLNIYVYTQRIFFFLYPPENVRLYFFFFLFFLLLLLLCFLDNVGLLCICMKFCIWRLCIEECVWSQTRDIILSRDFLLSVFHSCGEREMSGLVGCTIRV